MRATMRATTNRSVHLRSAPKGRVIDSAESIPCGTLLIVNNEEGKWLHVTAPDGTSGYLRKGSVCYEEKEHLELSQVLLEELQAVTDARPHPPSHEELQLLKKQRAEQTLERERLTGYLQPEQRKRKEFADILPLLHMAKLKALCLSGGGIRSATFNLGVLQGLARLGVLKETDYLSTVSGGGYIGSWLSSSIRWQKDAGAATPFEKVPVHHRLRRGVRLRVQLRGPGERRAQGAGGFSDRDRHRPIGDQGEEAAFRRGGGEVSLL